MNWVALGLWVGIPVLVIAVFWVMSKGSGGPLSYLFAQVFFILGYVYTLTSAVALATNQADNYDYPHRSIDDYLSDLRVGVVALLVGLIIVVYPLLPIVAKERTRKETQVQIIHEQYNAVHKHIEDRGYGWRNKKRMLAGKEPLDPLEMTIVITVLGVIAIGLAVLFVRTVFG